MLKINGSRIASILWTNPKCGHMFLGVFPCDVNCNYWICNDGHLHSAISKLCGHYCIFYCLHRCRPRGYNANVIIKKLTLDTGLNDYLINQYICYNKLLKWFVDECIRAVKDVDRGHILQFFDAINC